MPVAYLEDDEALDPALMPDLEGEPLPNMPRDPNRTMGRRGGEAIAGDDRRQIMKDYLSRQRDLSQGNRDLAFTSLLSKAANQIGTLGGKAASSAPLDEMNQQLMAENRQLMADERSDLSRRDKMREYLARQQERDQARTASAAMQEKRLGLQERSVAAAEKAAGIKQAEAAKPKDPTEGERKMAAFSERAQSANQAYENYIAQNPEAKEVSTMDAILSGAGQMIPAAKGMTDFWTSKQGRMRKQLEKEFIGAVLRPETGAAASDDEWELYGATYFPRGGDTAEQLDRKQLVRNQNIGTMQKMAGRAGTQLPSTQLAGTTQAPAQTPPKIPGVAGAVGGGQDRTEVKRQYSKSRDQTKVTYSDGTVEMLDGKQ